MNYKILKLDYFICNVQKSLFFFIEGRYISLETRCLQQNAQRKENFSLVENKVAKKKKTATTDFELNCKVTLDSFKLSR